MVHGRNFWCPLTTARLSCASRERGLGPLALGHLVPISKFLACPNGTHEGNLAIACNPETGTTAKPLRRQAEVILNKTVS